VENYVEIGGKVGGKAFSAVTKRYADLQSKSNETLRP